jgi:nuclear pore complex protein Nup205
VTFCDLGRAALISSEMDNPKAVQKYHHLLLAALRIIASIVISCGVQNAQALDQARGFLSEYRPLVVATLKRQANIGGFRDIASDDDLKVLDEVVDYFVLLISLTDFLEVSTPIPNVLP